MGCKSSLCADSNELILSQHLQEKEIDITMPVSEKSTNQSISTLNRLSRGPDPGRPAFLLKSFCVLMLKTFEDNEFLIALGDLWINEVFKYFEDSVALAEDLRTQVSLDSTGNSITIKHEIDGIRSFEKIAWFCQKIQSFNRPSISKFKYKNFIKSEEFLMSLGPLTISVYLRLGNEVDCGIGIEKPLDRKQMSQFLSVSKEAKNISTWSNNNGQPIPVSCSFSTLTQKKTINFFIFDGLKSQNFTRGLSAFYHFGAPVPEKLEKNFVECRTEELNCVLEFDNSAVTSVALYTGCFENCLLEDLDTFVDDKKWTQFQNFFTVKGVSLNLNNQGFTLREYSLI
jgi:hypothetical protein